MEGLNGGIISNVFAIVSLVCWIFVYTPQLYKNYKMKSNAAEALSMGFLVSWLIGDFFFIISGICKVFWLGEMPLALLLVGVWYTLADLILILQTVYYRKNYTVTVLQEKKLLPTEHNLQSERQFEQHLENPDTPPEASVLSMQSFNFLTFLPLLVVLVQLVSGFPVIEVDPELSDPEAFVGRNILLTPSGVAGGYTDLHHKHEMEKLRLIANICSWLAFTFFTGARLPQLYKNWKNKTAGGLSMLMFALCLSGNGTSFLAYMTHSAGMKANIPLIAGSASSFLLDALISVQTIYFRRKSKALRQIEDMKIGTDPEPNFVAFATPK